MKTDKPKGIDKWGPLSLILVYLLSWIGLICGIIAFFFLSGNLKFEAFITLLLAIASWALLNAFLYSKSSYRDK